MAEVVSLVQGSQSIDLTSGNYRTVSLTLAPSPPKEIWHEPDFGDRRLVRSEDTDRSCILNLRVPNTVADEDTLQNAIVAVRRYINEAIRYEQVGDNTPVYLQLQKNGATNAVNHRIKSGWVDDAQSHNRGERTVSGDALDIFVNLVLAPYGEWTSTITLANILPSSPHFVEWTSGTSSPAYADGWNAVGTPTTATEETTAYLIGGSSQKIVTDNSTGEGISSDTVSITGGNDVVGYAWIYIESGGDAVRVSITGDMGGQIDAASVTAAGVGGADKSATDAAGNVWYRVPVSGTSDGSDTTVYLQVWRQSTVASTNTTFYVDGCYIAEASAAPDAWMSATAIDNRYDPAEGENNINYIDLWGVPGDAPAWVENKLDFTTLSVAGDQIIMGRYAGGIIGIGSIIHWIESDEFTAQSGTGTSSTGSGTSDDHYHRLTDTGSGTDAKFYGADYTGTGALYRSFGPRHMYGIVRASSTSSTFQLTVRADPLGAAKFQSDLLSVTSTNTWEYLDFGAMDISETAAPNLPDSLYQQVQFDIELDIADSSGTMDLDALIIMPIASENLFIQAGPYGLTTDDALYTEGQYRRIFYEGAEYVPSFLGTMWEAAPGQAGNRFYYMISEDDNEYLLADAASVQLRIIPRTRHLLGT